MDQKRQKFVHVVCEQPLDGVSSSILCCMEAAETTDCYTTTIQAIQYSSLYEKAAVCWHQQRGGGGDRAGEAAVADERDQEVSPS